MSPPRPTPLIVSTGTVELPEAIAGATLSGGGLGDLLFASASADGSTAALMLNSQRPGVVALVRTAASGELAVEAREGNLVPAGSPLLARYDQDTDQVQFEELARGTRYRAARNLSVDADETGVAWDEKDTLWRLAADRPDRGLVRAVTNGRLTWTSIELLAPDDPTPRWRVTLRPADGPAFVADAALDHDGARVLVQLTDGKRASRLVAYHSGTGKPIWQVDTAAVLGYSGALVLSDDGTTVATVVSDPDRCETCERVEVRELAAGRSIRTVPLERSFILGRERGVEAYLGVLDGELWYRFRRGPQPADSARVEACTYQVFELTSGRTRATDAAWAGPVEDCRQVLLTLPIRGAVLGLRVLDRSHLEVMRFARAP